MIVYYDKARQAMDYINLEGSSDGDIYLANPRTGEVAKLSPEQLSFYDLGANEKTDIENNRKQRRQQKSKDRRNAKREYMRK